MLIEEKSSAFVVSKLLLKANKKGFGIKLNWLHEFVLFSS